MFEAAIVRAFAIPHQRTDVDFGGVELAVAVELAARRTVNSMGRVGVALV